MESSELGGPCRGRFEHRSITPHRMRRATCAWRQYTAVTRTISLAILATGLLACGCASAPPVTTPPPAPVFEQSLAWIIRLEDQRVLRADAPIAPAPAPAAGGRRRAAGVHTIPAPPRDLVAALNSPDPRMRRRAALASASRSSSRPSRFPPTMPR